VVLFHLGQLYVFESVNSISVVSLFLALISTSQASIHR